MLQTLFERFGDLNYLDISIGQQSELQYALKTIQVKEVDSLESGKRFILLVQLLRKAIEGNDKLHGDNYLKLLKSILSVGEDGLYSNDLRFLFELIQNVDDCDFIDPQNCNLDVRFDFSKDQIILSYNEVGFSPFNVFAITGIAEAAKNITDDKREIGEKGIGFKSVFGVAQKVLIQSGWFSFELNEGSFTIPIPVYDNYEYHNGTQMTLFLSTGKARMIYNLIKEQYCGIIALFSRNPIIFLEKLTHLRIYNDSWRSMEFNVSRKGNISGFSIERDVEISVDLHDYQNGQETNISKKLYCTRYIKSYTYSREACISRYGEGSPLGRSGGRPMHLQVLIPNPEFARDFESGALYSFLPTQIKLSAPIACHVPFKLDASREFVHSQDNNLWFADSCNYMSDLLDKVYLDLSKNVCADIVQYLPPKGESLISLNNGKERCLSEQARFNGDHYLKMSLFKTVTGEYKSASEIFTFSPVENVKDPLFVYSALHFDKQLFIPPQESRVSKLGIKTEKKINDRLCIQALITDRNTNSILDYLDSVGYVYNEKIINKPSDYELCPSNAGDWRYSFSTAQIKSLFVHKGLYVLLRNIACDSIESNKRIIFDLLDESVCDITEIMYEDFSINDTPTAVEKYLRFCKSKCICADIPEDEFFPCSNALVLSQMDPESSFNAFCYALDPKGSFVIRSKLRDATKRLDNCIKNKEISTDEFMKELRNIRLSVKDALGKDGYNSYIHLLLKSGTERGRFVQELLQNADDCQYPSNVIPNYSLKKQSNRIIAEYNEVGFTRDNVRSITAIGESTKRKLLNNSLEEIGEKGVGFKTIFAVASQVNIYSGEYSFGLSDQEPTIPRSLQMTEQYSDGTRMELTIKEPEAFPKFKDTEILDFCICLRKLKRLEIFDHRVVIEDTSTHRNITVNNRLYSFRRYEYRFKITDEKALSDKKMGTYEVSDQQMIVCYIPERNKKDEYFLYNGLPTKHKIKVPLVIDSPFALTTSREEIETVTSRWNQIIRKAMYNAIEKVLLELVKEKGAEAYSVLRFVPRRQGTAQVYVNDMFDLDYLSGYPFLSELKNSPIIPTYDKSFFAVSNAKTSYRFPEFVHRLIDLYGKIDVHGVTQKTIINVPVDSFESVLNALECRYAGFDMIFRIIERYATPAIRDGEFWKGLYSYLSSVELNDEQRARLRALPIVPVYGRVAGERLFKAWRNGEIYVKSGKTTSTGEYYLLNTEMLSKSDCEKILGVNINEMNSEWEAIKYQNSLERIITDYPERDVYYYLLQEFNSGNISRNKCKGILLDHRKNIPLKNQMGELVKFNLFTSSKNGNWFNSKMIKTMLAHDECKALADYMDSKSVKLLNFDDIVYYSDLTNDDIEELQSDDFNYGDEILRYFYDDGKITDELIEKYALGYLFYSKPSENDEAYGFPEDPVKDRRRIEAQILAAIKAPSLIIKKRVQREVHFVHNPYGYELEYDSNEIRQKTLLLYAPEGNTQKCFCQMCGRVKPKDLIEVNNIESEQKYYFPQTRITLCLECSKKFLALRRNKEKRNKIIRNIRNAEIRPGQGKVVVQIPNDETLTFTAKHLAEIQEIFKNLQE